MKSIDDKKSKNEELTEQYRNLKWEIDRFPGELSSILKKLLDEMWELKTKLTEKAPEQICECAWCKEKYGRK